MNNNFKACARLATAALSPLLTSCADQGVCTLQVMSNQPDTTFIVDGNALPKVHEPNTQTYTTIACNTPHNVTAQPDGGYTPFTPEPENL